MNTRNKKLAIALLMSIFMLTIFSLAGCKKKAEPAAPTDIKQVVSEAIEVEQTTCPVMGGAINKEIYTEYKGKKVYFCCAGCDETFKKDPEKYISKLPQFSN